MPCIQNTVLRTPVLNPGSTFAAMQHYFIRQGVVLASHIHESAHFSCLLCKVNTVFLLFTSWSSQQKLLHRWTQEGVWPFHSGKGGSLRAVKLGAGRKKNRGLLHWAPRCGSMLWLLRVSGIVCPPRRMRPLGPLLITKVSMILQSKTGTPFHSCLLHLNLGATIFSKLDLRNAY